MSARHRSREAGRGRVDAAVDSGASISAVNLSEMVARLADCGMAAEEIELTLQDLASVEVLDFDRSFAVAAGLLRPATRHLGLSLGDRACLALAAREGATALTADRAWADLDIGVAIEVIR